MPLKGSEAHEEKDDDNDADPTRLRTGSIVSDRP